MLFRSGLMFVLVSHSISSASNISPSLLCSAPPLGWKGFSLTTPTPLHFSCNKMTECFTLSYLLRCRCSWLLLLVRSTLVDKLPSFRVHLFSSRDVCLDEKPQELVNSLPKIRAILCQLQACVYDVIACRCRLQVTLQLKSSDAFNFTNVIQSFIRSFEFSFRSLKDCIYIDRNPD